LSKFLKYFVRFLLYQFAQAQTYTEDEMRKIWSKTKVCCVASASGIGDSVMATPLIEQIKRCKPEIKLIVVSMKTTTQVFVRNPNVDKIIQYNHNFDSIKFNSIIPFILMLWKIRRENIDVFLAAQPFNVIRHSLIAAFSGTKVKLKHTYDYGASTERDYSFIYHKLLPDSMARHRVELNLDFLRLLGEKVPESSISPQFFISKECQKRIDDLLQSYGKDNSSGKLIAIHPGGIRQNKRWPVERFAEVSKKLIKSGYTVCLVGGSYEINTCEDITAKIGTDRIINFTGNATLEETGGILKRCRCLISNDTGIMHLATATKTPVIAIFGPTDFRHIGPFSPKASVLYKSRNIQSITEEDVFKAVLEVLRSTV
jgi:lipopolysaccharide heptosyltransferase II